MKILAFAGVAACTTLVACGVASGEETSGGDAAAVASVDTSNGMIVCDMPNYDGMSGLTMTQTFILLDGEVKRYSRFQNLAFDLCEAGQDDCSLSLDDGHIVMDHLNDEGTRSQYDVDLATMNIVPRKTEQGEAVRTVPFEVGAKCRREPLPEGLTFK